jgi:hypothetical protein
MAMRSCPEKRGAQWRKAGLFGARFLRVAD